VISILKMAPLKRVESLREQSSRLISEHIAGHCIALDSYLQTKSSESTLKVENNEVTKPFLDFLTDEIPSVLLDNICHATVKILLQPLNGEERRRRNAPSPGLYSAILLLPQSTSRTLDFGSLFSGARLSKTSNDLVRSGLKQSLLRAEKLNKLVLTSKCTNDILESVGTACKSLQELYITMSELVTDAGLAHLVPNVSKVFEGNALSAASSDIDEPMNESNTSVEWSQHNGCPNLVIIDLTKCWNISAYGAKTLLLQLTKLKKLMYSNMKGILSHIALDNKSTSSFDRIEYFDSSEYPLITDASGVIPDTDPAKWLTGPVRLNMIPLTFPNVTILKMMLSDAEVKLLTEVQKLVHLEIEFSDDPGDGFQHLLDNHVNVENFILLFFQLGHMNASHLLSIAKNCLRLDFLRIVGFQVVNSGLLKPSCKYFQQLTQLWLSFYDDTCGDSDDEEHEPISRHSPDMIEFFLYSSSFNLKTINIHMNISHFLNDLYLHKLISVNPFQKLNRLGLTAPDDLDISMETARWIINNLNNIQSLTVSKWNITHKQLNILKKEVQRKNLDVILD